MTLVVGESFQSHIEWLKEVMEITLRITWLREGNPDPVYFDKIANSIPINNLILQFKVVIDVFLM